MVPHSDQTWLHSRHFPQLLPLKVSTLKLPSNAASTEYNSDGRNDPPRLGVRGPLVGAPCFPLAGSSCIQPQHGLAPSTLFPNSPSKAPIASRCLAAVGSPRVCTCSLLLLPGVFSLVATNWRIRRAERGAPQESSFVAISSSHPGLIRDHARGHAWTTPALHLLCARLLHITTPGRCFFTALGPSLSSEPSFPVPSCLSLQPWLLHPISRLSPSSQGQPSSAWVAAALSTREHQQRACPSLPHAFVCLRRRRPSALTAQSPHRHRKRPLSLLPCRALFPSSSTSS